MNRDKHCATWIGILFVLATSFICGRASADVYGGPPDPEELAMQQAGLTGAGLTFIDGDPFVRIQIEPDIAIGKKVGVGLDFVLLYNPNAEEGEDSILAEDGEKWDNASTILRAMRYIRYARPRDPFYARFGELDYVTIGHGFIMSGYSNYDRRGLRVNLSTKTRKVGIETLINDLGDPRIFGGRLYIRPLQGDNAPAIIGKLEVGVTYLTDIEPDLIPDDEAEGMEKTIDEDPLIALGADIGFPLIENSLLRLDLYDDLAFLNTKPKADGSGDTETATGNAVGLGLSISKALFKVEYRTFDEGFIPTIFDYTYQASAIAVIPIFLGMEEDKDAGKSRHGYFSMFAWQPIPKVHILGTFEDYNISDPKLYAGITESGLVPKMSFRAFYTKRDIGEVDADGDDPSVIEDLFKLDEKSALIVRIGYALYPPLEVAIVREFRFRQIEDEDGKTGFETIQKTSFELGVNLQF